MNVNRSSAPCGADPRPCDACGAAVAADAAAGLRHSSRTKNSFAVRLRDLLRHPHNLFQGARYVLSWPLSPAHAQSHIPSALGPAAHAATNHSACGLLCVQVLGRDEHPPGAAFSALCTACASTSCSRWMALICSARCSAGPEHSVGISAIVRCQPVSVVVHAWEFPRAICKGARHSTLGVCDSIDVLRLYVSEGVRCCTVYAHSASAIFLRDGWTVESRPPARPRRNPAVLFPKNRPCSNTLVHHALFY